MYIATPSAHPSLPALINMDSLRIEKAIEYFSRLSRHLPVVTTPQPHIFWQVRLYFELKKNDHALNRSHCILRLWIFGSVLDARMAVRCPVDQRIVHEGFQNAGQRIPMIPQHAQRDLRYPSEHSLAAGYTECIHNILRQAERHELWLGQSQSLQIVGALRRIPQFGSCLMMCSDDERCQ